MISTAYKEAVQTLEQRVLSKAVDIAGSERALARSLQISSHDLRSFLAGEDKPTRAVFLAACDLLIERGQVGVFDPAPRDNQEEDSGSKAG